MIRFLAVLLLMVGISAKAYIPPPTFILSEAVKSRAGVKTLQFEGRVTRIDNNATFKEGVKIDFATGRVLLTYSGPNDEPLGSIETRLQNLHRLGKFWFGVALDPNAARFKQALQELNALPTETMEAKLDRIDNQVAWGWGEEERIEFSKDDFTALDYQADRSGSNKQELQFKEYSSAGAAVRVPKVAFVKLEGKDTYRFELRSLKANTPVKAVPTSAAINANVVKDWIALVR